MISSSWVGACSGSGQDTMKKTESICLPCSHPPTQKPYCSLFQDGNSESSQLWIATHWGTGEERGRGWASTFGWPSSATYYTEEGRKLKAGVTFRPSQVVRGINSWTEGCERGKGRCWMDGEQEPRGGRREVQNDSRRHGKPTFPLKHSLNLSGRETGSAKPRGGLVLCCLGKSRRESERAADNPTALVLPGGQASPLTSSVSLDFFLSVKETSLCRTLFFLCPSMWVLCKARNRECSVVRESPAKYKLYLQRAETETFQKMIGTSILDPCSFCPMVNQAGLWILQMTIVLSMDAPSLDAFKASLDVAQGSLI